MSSQQQNIENALKKVLDGENVLFHGPGGVGKSYALRILKQKLEELGKTVFITATTGKAAYGLSDPERKIFATTLHSFAGIYKGEGHPSLLVRKIRTSRKCMTRWKSCDVLIIDEVSMLGANLFEKINEVAKDIRENEEPMGGIRVIFSGDFLQLPPVKDDWIFNSDVWELMEPKIFIMETPYRYKDESFFQLLLRVRRGEMTEDDYKLLKKRVKSHKKFIELLEEHNGKDPNEIIRPTMVFSRRMDVDSFNMRELAKLKSTEKAFYAEDDQLIYRGNPKVEDYLKILDTDISREIVLKEGAQVMLKANLDVKEGLVNGTRGVVNQIIDNEAVIVKFLNGKKIRVDRVNFTMEDKYCKVFRCQIPLVLAYAITIHKSQSSTLDYIVVDLGPSVFSDGAAYTALSRCREMKGLFISELHRGSILTNTEALDYVKKHEKQ